MEKILILFTEIGLVAFLMKKHTEEICEGTPLVSFALTEPVDDRIFSRAYVADASVLGEEVDQEKLQEIILMLQNGGEDEKLAETWILGGYLNQ